MAVSINVFRTAVTTEYFIDSRIHIVHVVETECQSVPLRLDYCNPW